MFPDFGKLSPIAGKYEAKLDRDSAHEILTKRAEAAAKAAAEAERREEEGDEAAREFNAGRRYSGGRTSGGGSRSSSTRGASSKNGSFGEEVAKVVIKELKGTTGKRIVRGIFGTLFKAR